MNQMPHGLRWISRPYPIRKAELWLDSSCDSQQS